MQNKYFIEYITPKCDKSTWKTLWYTIRVINDKWTFNFSDFFSVEDMKTLYWCNTEIDCLNLRAKEVELITTIKIKK